MAEQDKDAELTTLVKDMLKAGKSEDDVAKFIQTYDDIGHPILSRLKGAGEGVVAGLVSGVMALPTAIRDTVMDTISVVQGQTPEHAKAFVEGIGKFLPTVANAEPREQAKMLAEAVTSFGVGLGTGAAAAKYNKAIANSTGKLLEYAGDHPFATRMSGGAAIGAGIATGRPEVVLGGLATSAAPAVFKRAGQALLKYGGGQTAEEEAVALKALPSGARNIDVKGAIRSIGQVPNVPEGTSARIPYAMPEPPLTKGAQAAAENEAKATAILNAREGMTAKTPTISESTSATQPGGVRLSMRKQFVPAEATGDDAFIASLMKQNPGLTAEKAKEVLALSKAAPVPVATGRPAIKVQPSNDLTELTKNLDAQIMDAEAAKGVPNNPVAQKLEAERTAVEPAKTPANLKMGSEASPKEIAADVRVRAQGGGGIRIGGARPGEPIGLTPTPLPEEGAALLKQYLKENPSAVPAVVEDHIRKLLGLPAAGAPMNLSVVPESE